MALKMPTVEAGRVGEFLRSDKGLLAALAVAKLLAHLLTANQYGYFIDEFYTADAGKHLLSGLVDIPPLAPFLSYLFGQLFGYSMFAIRIVPAVAGAFTVYLAGMAAREMGGGRFAQAMTALCVLLGPLWLSFDSYFAYDSIDQLALALFSYFLIRVLRKGGGRGWIAVGAAAALAILSKYTFLYIGAATVLSLLATKERKCFADGRAWAGAGIFLAAAGALALWQASLGWPILEYWKNYGQYRTIHFSLPDFLLSQASMMNPFAAPLWGLGAVLLLAGKLGRELRPLALVAAFVVAMLWLTHAQAYMAASVYPPLVAAGAMGLERLRGAKLGRWLRGGALALVAASGLVLAPFSLPLFSPRAEGEYAAAMGFLWRDTLASRLAPGKLPERIALRFGWKELAAAMGRAFAGLSPADRAACGVYTLSFAEAGAIDMLGGAYGLPEATSGHLSYGIWGTPTPDAKVWICSGTRAGYFKQLFLSVEPAGEAEFGEFAVNPLVADPVFICRDPRVPIEELLRVWRHYD